MRCARWCALFLGGLLILTPVAACGPATGSDDPAAESLRYELHGEVVEVAEDEGTITLAHEEIEGFMSAMTMPFNVRDEWIFDAAEPGARVTATLVVQGMSSWLEDVVVRKAADRGAAAEVVVTQPDPGAAVPVIELVDQDGTEFSLADYAGEWWAFTFIYTTCPLPDFCPRMTGNMAGVYEAIEADPERYGDARLLAVTVDPANDTPAVLREYGLEYVGDAEGFRRWSFARADPEALGELAGFTGLRFMPEAGEVVHSLRTVVVDPDGRVVTTLVGNRWEPEEMLQTLATAVAAGAREAP